MLQSLWIFNRLRLLAITILLITTPSICTLKQSDLLFPSGAVKRYAHTEPGSYFGYSVAAYVGQAQSFCLVGAPKARLDQLTDVSLSAFNQGFNDPTGLVYRIDLDQALPYCSLVPIATTDESRKEHGTPTPGISKWLGGSVAAASNSLNGIQLGCDPRYIYTPDLINQTTGFKFGSEHWGSRTPGREGTVPRTGRTMLGTGQCALYTGASMKYTPVVACLTQEEGACLSGFSADVEAGTAFGEALVALGMPGSYLTEGNVFLGHYRGRELLNAVRLKSSPEDLKHMGFNLGYAVKLARLMREPAVDGDVTDTHKLSTSILTSSSMWIDNDYRGIVMILDQAMDLGGITYLKDKWGHIGSFFGYSLTTADLNADGIVDIIVGAPYFTERKKTTDESQITTSIPVRGTRSNSPPLNEPNLSKVPDADLEDKKKATGQETNWGRLLPDIGRVYLFYGRPGNETGLDASGRPDYTTGDPMIIHGPRLTGGRFGHAVTSLGDVDGDGTEDLAISCPYCTNPKGSEDKGAIFIYLGRKLGRITEEPAQVIWASDLPKDNPLASCGEFGFADSGPRTFKSFGWSLSGGTDLDGNRAPDIVVGDFESDQVAIIRARNTLWFDNPYWDLPLARTLPWSGPDQTPCGPVCQFEVRLIVTVHGKPELLRDPAGFKLRIRTDLDAGMEELSAKRLTGLDLIEPSGVQQNVVKFGILDTVVTVRPAKSIDSSNRLTLLTLRLEPVMERVLRLLWKPIRINATITPVPDSMPHVSESSSAPIPSWTLHPFLGERHFVSRPLRFANPACGSDNVCMTELQVRLTDQSHGPTQSEIVYFRERISQRNLTVLVGNLGENAYAAFLRLIIPHQFSFTTPENLECESNILTAQKATELLCSLGDPLQYTGTKLIPFVIHLNTAGAFNPLDFPMSDAPHSGSDARNNTENKPGNQPEHESDRFRGKPRLNRRDALKEREDFTTVLTNDSVTIHAEVFSGNEDLDPWNNKASITYKLQLAAQIDLSSSALDRTTIDSRNFTAQLYEMQRVHPETLGPEIKHIYLVSNNGPSPIENLWINISMPVKTENDEHLVYFLDRIRYHAEDGGPPRIVNMAPEVISAEGHVRGICLTPDWALNPLRLNAVNRSPLGNLNRVPRHAEQSATNDQPDSSDSSQTQTYVEPNQQSTARATRSILPGVRKRQQEIIKCGQESPNLGMPICATIYCRIDSLSRGDAVRIVLRGHVWADTFFRYKIPDLAIVSEAHSELAEYAFGIPVHGNRSIQPLAISQNFVFHGIKVPAFREIPLWPIILGCILGVALLAGIIFGLWRCGFFRRKPIYETQPVPAGPIVSPTVL